MFASIKRTMSLSSSSRTSKKDAPSQKSRVAVFTKEEETLKDSLMVLHKAGVLSQMELANKVEIIKDRALARQNSERVAEVEFVPFQAEYVWIGGSGNDLRCKTRTITSPINDVSDLPDWNYDGSSTDQAPGDDSEVIIKPCAIYRDPFRQEGGQHILVMCDCYTPQGEPIPTNHRFPAKQIFDQALGLKPWYGFEQEYTLFDRTTRVPFGWPEVGFPRPQGPYYCSAGAENAFGRAIAECHYRACLYAGIQISGINAEVMPGQWEYQVGPAEGIGAGDQVMMSRYLLLRVGELFNVSVSFDPKPIPGDWNGAGMHSNFSTEPMRQDGGYAKIIDAIKRLEAKHDEHIAIYGSGNERRLTGAHETAPITKFSYGVANRGASVRIPRTAEADQKGYFEDRRPASNACPYQVSGKILQTCCL